MRLMISSGVDRIINCEAVITDPVAGLMNLIAPSSFPIGNNAIAPKTLAFNVLSDWSDMYLTCA